MKKNILIVLSLIATIVISTESNAQGLIDGFSPKKNELSVTLSYTNASFEEFYLGDVKQDAVPAHDEISQDIISLYAKYGITDRVSVIFSAPYISAQGDGVPDPVNGETSVSGVQDVSVAIKVNAAKFDLKGGNLNLITALTTHIPTGYEPNGILSLGSGAFGVDYTAGLHLNTDVGFFSTLLASYNLRGTANSDVSNTKFQVPNAFQLNGKIGYSSSFIYAELWASHQNSEEGVDIGGTGFAGNFPETDVDFSSVGITLYKNIIPEIGLSLGYGKVIDGRNVGASSTFSAGLTYCFIK